MLKTTRYNFVYLKLFVGDSISLTIIFCFQLKPLIDSVFSYDQLQEAYAKMKEGHARGKIVIEIKK